MEIFFLYFRAIQVNPVEFVSDYFMSLCGRSTDSQHQSAADQSTTSQQTLQLSKSMQGETGSIIAQCSLLLLLVTRFCSRSCFESCYVR